MSKRKKQQPPPTLLHRLLHLIETHPKAVCFLLSAVAAIAEHLLWLSADRQSSSTSEALGHISFLLLVGGIFGPNVLSRSWWREKLWGGSFGRS